MEVKRQLTGLAEKQALPPIGIKSLRQTTSLPLVALSALLVTRGNRPLGGRAIESSY